MLNSLVFLATWKQQQNYTKAIQNNSPMAGCKHGYGEMETIMFTGPANTQ